MKSHPVIYLQWHSDDCPDECAEEITWCQDRISDADIEYIRKDLFDDVVSFLYQHHNVSYLERQDLSSECYICGNGKLLSILGEVR